MGLVEVLPCSDGETNSTDAETPFQIASSALPAETLADQAAQQSLCIEHVTGLRVDRRLLAVPGTHLHTRYVYRQGMLPKAVRVDIAVLRAHGSDDSARFGALRRLTRCIRRGGAID